MPESKESPKTKLAELFKSLSYFQPERDQENQWTGKFLVNQKLSVVQQGMAPERDALLHMIGEASIELTSFIQEHNHIKAELQDRIGEFIKIQEALNLAVGGMEQLPVLQQVETVVARYRQIYDLVHLIAHDLPSDQCKGKAFQFLAWKGETVKPLVNQNEEETQGNAGGVEPICTCQQNRDSTIKNFLCQVHGSGIQFNSIYQGYDTKRAGSPPPPAAGEQVPPSLES